MVERFADATTKLRSLGVLPPSPIAVFIVGSMARGWDNANSDVDLYVVSADPWNGSSGIHVPLTPDIVPTETIELDSRRWELKYWLEEQVRQVLDKASWEAVGSRPFADLLGKTEIGLLSRLCSCLPLVGRSWIAAMQDDVRSSAFPAILIAECATAARFSMEDATGQLVTGDAESAVLSARLAFGHTVDAFLLQHGELDRSPKWRARRVRAAALRTLPFEEYWSVESMSRFNRAEPHVWVRDVLARCASLLAAVQVDQRLVHVVSAGSASA